MPKESKKERWTKPRHKAVFAFLRAVMTPFLN